MPITQVWYAVLVVKITFRLFMTFSCQSTVLFLELTLYVVTLSIGQYVRQICLIETVDSCYYCLLCFI